MGDNDRDDQLTRRLHVHAATSNASSAVSITTNPTNAPTNIPITLRLTTAKGMKVKILENICRRSITN